jgi:hypothetical protein
MQRSSLIRAGLVAGACAVVGAAGGIAGSAAAPSKKGHDAQNTTSTENRPPGRGPGVFAIAGGPPVHAELVVPNKDRTAFETVTMDNGKFKSLSGDQLTITEGTDSVTYKDVAVTIPSGATVKRNFADAQLSDIKAGDRVHVASSPEGTFVFAVDAQHQDQGPGGREVHGHFPGGGPPPGGPPPDGPPPFGP